LLSILLVTITQYSPQILHIYTRMQTLATQEQTKFWENTVENNAEHTLNEPIFLLSGYNHLTEQYIILRHNRRASKPQPTNDLPTAAQGTLDTI